MVTLIEYLDDPSIKLEDIEANKAEVEKLEQIFKQPKDDGKVHMRPLVSEIGAYIVKFSEMVVVMVNIFKGETMEDYLNHKLFKLLAEKHGFTFNVCLLEFEHEDVTVQQNILQTIRYMVTLDHIINLSQQERDAVKPADAYQKYVHHPDVNIRTEEWYKAHMHNLENDRVVLMRAPISRKLSE